MAKKIEWSKRSQRDRFKILDYWEKRNKSKAYSIKLNELFVKGIEKAAEFPEYGIPTKSQRKNSTCFKLSHLLLYFIPLILRSLLSGIAGGILIN
jgi:plasmid stabilization system protein ParE